MAYSVPIRIRHPLTISLMTLVLLTTGCTSLSKPSIQPMPEEIARKVADRVIQDNHEPIPFDWGEGVLLGGMMHAGITFHEPRYVQFVQTWADHWNKTDLPAMLDAGLPSEGLRKYCGHWGPAYALVLLYEQTKNVTYLKMAQHVADFIMTKATRTKDGGLGHWADNYQLWVDTLYMICPPFSHMSRITNQREYLQEALRQMDIYTRHTWNTQTGLYWHMYDEPSGQLKGVQWARGNGWVAMSYIELLQHLDPQSPEFRKHADNFRRLMDGLLAVQDRRSRLWHTVLDHPETYLETSASAMILSSLAHADRLGFYKPKDKSLIPNTWAALAAKVDAENHVIDVSGGTMPEILEVYATKIRGTYTWGTGAFLMAAGAMEQWRTAR